MYSLLTYNNNNSSFDVPDYEKKIGMCKQRIDAAKSEIVDDAQLDLLQNELQENLERESLLREELR